MKHSLLQARGMSARDLMAAAECAAKARVDNGQPVRLSPKAEESGGEANIYMQDAIGGWFGVSATEFIRELDAVTAPVINLHINCPGGDVLDARDIQAALGRKREAGAKVIAHINGLCASAATYIAVSQDEVRMADGAMFMVHNAWVIAFGNANDMMDIAALLEKIDAGIARDYERKTGASLDQIRQWMDAETWFDAEEAKANGFVDSVFVPGGAAGETKPEARAMAGRDVQPVCMDSATLARRIQVFEDFGN